MPHYIVLPSLGDKVHSATVVEWKNRRDGIVKVGDEIVEVETGKASIDLTSEFDGILVWQVFSPACNVKVGETLAVIALPDEDAAAIRNEAMHQFPFRPSPDKPQVKQSFFARLFGLRS